jgi:cob(I)alamin adenosyltransferase
MSIVTKQGDRGKTKLFTGEEVSKDDVRMEAIGTLDELVSSLGFARSIIDDGAIATSIENLQNSLFRVGGELACTDPSTFGIEPTTGKHVEEIEGLIVDLEARVGMPKSFIVPGENKQSAALDVARTVARRLERRVVKASNGGIVVDSNTFVYLNRVSDYIFLLGREVEVE